MAPLNIKKFMIALVLAGVTQVALGSFTGTSNKKTKNLYSLKQFNKNFYRTASPFSLRAGFDYKGSRIMSQRVEPNGDLTFSSILRFEKGNTTYIYPYTHKVVLPRFKVPTAPAIR